MNTLIENEPNSPYVSMWDWYMLNFSRDLGLGHASLCSTVFVVFFAGKLDTNTSLNLFFLWQTWVFAQIAPLSQPRSAVVDLAQKVQIWPVWRYIREREGKEGKTVKSCVPSHSFLFFSSQMKTDCNCFLTIDFCFFNHLFMRSP